ncbi:MAG: acyl-CoA dehydrogenase family protein, partial [Candidatus Rokuibacteriota bacterium]
LGPLTRGETLATVAAHGALDADAAGSGWALRGRVLAENAARAAVFIVWDAPGLTCFVLSRDTAGLALGAPQPALGTRALPLTPLVLERAPVGPGDALGTADDGGASRDLALALLRIGAAAIAVGLAQAAFEAALRYSQQRTAFGKPIAQHQAIQLKLADMATSTAAARLLLGAAAERGGHWPPLAKVLATETACDVTLEAMRVHGGYGYTAEFPVERYYRDAAQLSVFPRDNDAERRAVAAALVEASRT